MNDIKDIKEFLNEVVDLICGHITKSTDETKDYNRFIEDMKNDEKFQEITKEMTEHI